MNSVVSGSFSRRSLYSVAASFFILPLLLITTGWFSSKDKGKGAAAGVREIVYRKLNEQEAQRFVSLVKVRTGVAEELLVFKRVIAEKRGEIEKYNESFVRTYHINPTSAYRYDPGSNALYRIELDVSGGVTNNVEYFDRTIAKEFGEGLVREMLGKQIASQQLQSLTLLVREKTQEHELVNAALLKEFDIKSSMNYRYDSDKSTIYVVEESSAVKNKLGTDQTSAAEKVRGDKGKPPAAPPKQ